MCDLAYRMGIVFNFSEIEKIGVKCARSIALTQQTNELTAWRGIFAGCRLLVKKKKQSWSYYSNDHFGISSPYHSTRSVCSNLRIPLSPSKSIKKKIESEDLGNGEPQPIYRWHGAIRQGQKIYLFMSEFFNLLFTSQLLPFQSAALVVRRRRHRSRSSVALVHRMRVFCVFFFWGVFISPSFYFILGMSSIYMSVGCAGCRYRFQMVPPTDGASALPVVWWEDWFISLIWFWCYPIWDMWQYSVHVCAYELNAMDGRFGPRFSQLFRPRCGWWSGKSINSESTFRWSAFGGDEKPDG